MPLFLAIVDFAEGPARELRCLAPGRCSISPAPAGDGSSSMVQLLDSTPSDDTVVVVIAPDQSEESMRQTVLNGLTGHPHDLVIDLRDVDHVSNQELAVLVGARARQRARHQTLILVCGPGSGTEQALSRAGMRGMFTTVSRIEANN
jgi:anti-anti-sigma regulatory factor